ncbi:MAG: hypothetical protein ACK5O2_08335 [Microthrixaceae bacterium]
MAIPANLPRGLTHAVPLSAYLDWVDTCLEPRGFSHDATLAAVSICRDELTQHVMADVTGRWGATFALGGLGGIPSLGRTGWGACLAHVPERPARGKLLILGAPHIGVTGEGSLGENLRRGQHLPTPTCGALSYILGSWGEHPDGGPDASGLADGEAQLLRRLVEGELDHQPDGVIELTLAAAHAVEHEMTTQLDALAPWESMDVAVFIAIQVHLAEGEDHMAPVVAHLRGPGGSTEVLG